MTLIYPWFALGLLAIAIPIIIHFFELRKPQLISFTNVGFIREVKLVTARQRKLKHLLVLLARVGFVLFLVLMFCQPFLPAPKQNVNSAEAVSILLDTSPSMQAQGANEQPLFDKAIAEANGLIEVYPATTQFQLNGTPELLTKTAFQAATEQLTLSGLASGILRNALVRTQTSRKTTSSQTFIFSDFQKNDFSFNWLTQADSINQVFLVPVARDNARNVYVDSIALDDAFVRRGNDILLRVRLHNGGDEAVTDCQVKLFVGEKQAAAYRTSISAGESATTVVRVRLEEATLQRCRVEIEDFPVTFDNTYYFTLLPSPQVRIADVAMGEPATQRLYANETLFAYSKSTPQAVNYSQLESANMIVVQQPRVDVSLRENIKQLVKRGGSVVIVPPATEAGRASYSQLFQELGINSIQWEAVAAGSPTLRDVATPSLQNPFFRDVFASQNRQTVMPKVSPVLRWSRSDADILRMQDGEGYLASFASGRGTVYIFSAPFEDAYSNFTNHALFVPVMYRLAMLSFRNDQQLAYRLNQRTVVMNVSNAADNAEQVFKITKDSLTFIPVQRMQAGELRFDVPPGMQGSGFYELTRNGRTIKTLAFNFDKSESDLTRYTVEELRNIAKDYPNVQIYDASGGQSVAAQYRAERVGTPLWQYCLWAALACLLIEALLLRFMNTSRKITEPAAVAA